MEERRDTAPREKNKKIRMKSRRKIKTFERIRLAILGATMYSDEAKRECYDVIDCYAACVYRAVPWKYKRSRYANSVAPLIVTSTARVEHVCMPWF